MKKLKFADAEDMAKLVSGMFPNVLVQTAKCTDGLDAVAGYFYLTMGAELVKSYGFLNGAAWYGHHNELPTMADGSLKPCIHGVPPDEPCVRCEQSHDADKYDYLNDVWEADAILAKAA